MLHPTKIMLLTLLLYSLHLGAQPKQAVNNKIADLYIPTAYQPDGYLGQRIKINTDKRLLTLDIESILLPYRKRPGVQQWVGEHVGKFLHACAHEYMNTGNTAIKKRMDYAAKELMATQLADGYLGTYLDKDRWTSWDVWSHKYNMIGLLAYHEVTGDKAALESCRKMADLLAKTFGEGEGKKDIIKSGTHVGMASTSVLEPMVMLYRYTGEQRYLDFCNYILKAWEQPNGPKLISSLTAQNGVFKTANAKAYEMLSDLVGLVDLYRLTGKAEYLQAVNAAWNDIVNKRLYIHGTASYNEHFQADHDLKPAGGYPWGSKFIAAGEGCVTVTWLQINWHLLRLTGEQKYAQEIERAVYNALLAAQSPVNGRITYFMPLIGRKRFGEVTHGIEPDVSCCSSSIPRGIAMIPQFSAGTIQGNPAILLYAAGTFKTQAQVGKKTVPVTFSTETDFPAGEEVSITVKPEQKAKFKLLLNVPEWATDFTAQIGEETYTGKPASFLAIDRTWNTGDVIRISIKMPIKTVADNNKGSNLVAVKRGPQLLSQDDNVSELNGLPGWGWIGKQVYKFAGNVNGKKENYVMVPLADAGQTMADYRVLIDKVQIIEEKQTPTLAKYRKQLADFRRQYRTYSLPDVNFYLFGMGNRTKLIYQKGQLSNAVTGELIKEWPVKSETIIPNAYQVELELLTDAGVTIFEDENGVYIRENGKDNLVAGTNSPIKLPTFSNHKYSEILKVLNQEILVNILENKPLPNLFVYTKPWRRDAAMMAMSLKASGNLNLIKDWVLGLDDPYDRNNKGESEPDNLGQTLYLLSLFTDKNHPLVQKILNELPKYEEKDAKGTYIQGNSDFHLTPVYQTKWLKFGLKALGLPDKYVIPQVQDNYSSLFWWDYKYSYLKGTRDAYDEWKNDKYPYIGWASDHFHGTKRNPISNRDYPLTWEKDASQANYKGNETIDKVYVKEKIGAPHTWHASEVFLYLLGDENSKVSAQIK